MTYLALCALFLGLAVAAAVVLNTATSRRGGRRMPFVAVALGGAVLLILTAVFDTVMIAAGMFTYSPEHILGTRLGLAPIEDFTYPLAMLALLPALWSFLRSRRDP